MFLPLLLLYCMHSCQFPAGQHCQSCTEQLWQRHYLVVYAALHMLCLLCSNACPWPACHVGHVTCDSGPALALCHCKCMMHPSSTLFVFCLSVESDMCTHSCGLASASCHVVHVINFVCFLSVSRVTHDFKGLLQPRVMYRMSSALVVCVCCRV